MTRAEYTPPDQNPRPDEQSVRRRDLLLDALRQRGPTRVRDFTAALGWDSHEVVAQLRSLQATGLAAYDPATRKWTATTTESGGSDA